jgi:hypothetical protein
MRFYTKTHKHYCGIDLHARSMYVCVLDQEGEVLLHRDLPCEGRKTCLLEDAPASWALTPGSAQPLIGHPSRSTTSVRVQRDSSGSLPLPRARYKLAARTFRAHASTSPLSGTV